MWIRVESTSKAFKNVTEFENISAFDRILIFFDF